MAARVMVIGLDGAEVNLIDELFNGRPPLANSSPNENIAWGSLEMDNPMETLPGALWNEINSGRSCGNQPYYYWHRQLRTGEAIPRPIDEKDINPQDYFWVAASRAGRRVAVLDPTYATLYDQLNGVQLNDWGMHDARFIPRSHPAGLLQEMLDRHGPHPVTAKARGRCDIYRKSQKGYEELLGDLCEGIRRRTFLYLDLLGREDWDLFFCTYSETHCVGHHFWHFHDPQHYNHDPNAPAHLKQAVQKVYERVFDSINELVKAAGTDSNVLQFAPQGMQPFTGGLQMLPEILVRLGMGSDRGAADHSLVRMLQNKVKQHAPKGAYPMLYRITEIGLVKRVQGKVGALLNPFESAGTRAATVANNRIGAVRLNLRGREPFGCIEPGEQAEAVLAELRTELFALRHPKSGEPLVKRIATAEEAFGPDHHPDTPDLLLEFRTDMGPIVSARSDRIGTVHVPFGKLLNSRTGDHNKNSRFWAKGPKITAHDELPQASVVDIAPTVLKLLDVSLPDHYDGSAIKL